MGDYRKLAVWEKAHALAIGTHRVSCGIRSAKYTAIRGQLIRASAANPANIVEGSGQKSAKELSADASRADEAPGWWVAEAGQRKLSNRQLSISGNA